MTISTKPLDNIKKYLLGVIPDHLLGKIPNRWDKIGDVLILKIPDILKPYKNIIAEAYAKYIKCRAVLNDTSGIQGVYREPMVEHLYGAQDTKTIHVENNIRYHLDPQHIMFSSGNMHERIRMSTISNREETVIDLFAGIGYFTLPIAVYSRPCRIYACEINPLAYNFLVQNITLNNVNDIVQPLIGDNRVVAPRNTADRVILGYLHRSIDYIPLALECLKNHKGVIHYHGLHPEEDIPNKPLKKISDIAKEYNRKIHLDKYVHVKSYAPRINHIVLDITSR
ncbi:MAG: class I SAM-dependent methyltransferase family protein [Candidatus Thermoplasmatota archaeon]